MKANQAGGSSWCIGPGGLFTLSWSIPAAKIPSESPHWKYLSEWTWPTQAHQNLWGCHSPRLKRRFQSPWQQSGDQQVEERTKESHTYWIIIFILPLFRHMFSFLQRRSPQLWGAKIVYTSRDAKVWLGDMNMGRHANQSGSPDSWAQ